MRYRLRTLLILLAVLLAVLPLIVAGCNWQEVVAVVSFLVNGE